MHNFDDELKGINETLYSMNERIKAFNKKVAIGKADTQILLERHKNGVDAKFRHVQQEVEGLEDLVLNISPR